MSRKYHLPWIIIGILLLICLYVLAYRIVHQPASPKDLTQALTHPVLVVDLNNNQLITQADLQAGRDAILGMLTGPKNDEQTLFNSFSALGKLDLNKDRRLDKFDPVFGKLVLVYIDPHNQQKNYVSLTSVGIQAIILHKGKLQQVNSNDDDNSVGQAILNDGQTRLIRAIQVNVKK